MASGYPLNVEATSSWLRFFPQGHQLLFGRTDARQAALAVGRIQKVWQVSVVEDGCVVEDDAEDLLRNERGCLRGICAAVPIIGCPFLFQPVGCT